MRTLWLLAKAGFFIVVGLVCTVMAGYALVDIFIILRQLLKGTP